MAEQQASEAGKTAESFLSKWLKQRQRVRDLARQLREAQERVRTLERDYPWLGQIKGMLRKRDGNMFDIPAGPKIAKVAPQGETQPASPQASKKTPSQPKEEIGKKRKVASLMEKPQREAESKRICLQFPPAAPSISTPKNPFHLSDLSEVNVQQLREALQAMEVAGRKDS